ncbi:hypothetical protein BWQ96_04268 [Gracilariopsis chorda]|uniref:Uncharacterized protein n=1 Tax=Gracilariopsis chorda TaxID=448386 RepID=A0A2V3IV40_9FLOR|nr:hypothetical protein BWQ96_04268 [Gracilariopsis chorda]|eukprot:PXF45955.1 hypothetical protein BWQ96_04268 [Gracilariopsis chorda]
MFNLVLSLFTLLLLSVVESSLIHTQGSSETLLQYGSAESTQFFLFELNDTAQLVNTTLETSNHSIITSYVIKVDQISDTLFNITATLFFEYLPGEAVYQIAARTESPGGASIYTMERNHSVYGMAFYDDSHGTMALISGDFGYGLSLISSSLGEEPVRLKYIANVPREVAFNLTANVLFNRVQGAMLEDDDVSIDGDGLYIKLRPHRIGSALITIESSNLVVDGESFETAVIVRVRDLPE